MALEVVPGQGFDGDSADVRYDMVDDDALVAVVGPGGNVALAAAHPVEQKIAEGYLRALEAGAAVELEEELGELLLRRLAGAADVEPLLAVSAGLVSAKI
jgi:hypothetical protein